MNVFLFIQEKQLLFIIHFISFLFFDLHTLDYYAVGCLCIWGKFSEIGNFLLLFK